MSSSVVRLHRALVEAMRRNRPNAPNGAVTVAEIYQDLVPYRSVRSSLGFALNADYEFALLQLLAGVEGLARIEPAEAREALRLELESPNPNTGVFRGYAACDVSVTPLDDAGASETEQPAAVAETGWSTPAEVLAAVDAADRSRSPEPAVPMPERTREREPAGPSAERAREREFGGPSAERAREREPAAPTREPPASRPGERNAAAAPIAAYPTSCRSCGQRLPGDRAVRFCPQCGVDQQAQKCVSCGEELDAGWKFCITCGEAVRR